VHVEDTQTAELVCYADDVRHALSALVANSLDALAMQGGGHLYARIRDGLDPRTGVAGVYLTLADTGVGIGRDTMGRLFEPFNTTKGIRGTGLGLWVTKGILDKHGAQAQVRSRVDSGTVVRIFFPMQPSNPAVPNAAENSSRLSVN
jgi:signal transduction histidine kinase